LSELTDEIRELVKLELAYQAAGGCPAYEKGSGSSMFRTLTVQSEGKPMEGTCWWEDSGPIYVKCITPEYSGKAKVFGESTLTFIPLPPPPSQVTIVVEKYMGREYESGPGYLRLKAKWEQYREVNSEIGLNGQYSVEIEFEAYERPYPGYSFARGIYRISAVSRSPIDEVKTSYIYLDVWTRGY
jgi:hypothetical protein